ncbi:hypothetical protein AJ80_00137 [Polytolypa hystricis UAMH7299]|uniref:Zn(2)-C6 fungal-type domain-containing protein n=1 Tax=Polytolypa hystricis (strain UAMH7299) TaxID=1447883 RepID=A0A2B7Z2V8_POLH7|nr:hypothetical protein AJ80_00137 [Polytolypa hystricis UAMH7299]
MSLSSPKAKTGGAQPRQIRFVSSNGQPQAKRRRVTAACFTCRKRKIRCSGEQPECKTCSDYGHTCLGYPEPASSQSLSQAPGKTETNIRSPEAKDAAPPPQKSRSIIPSGVTSARASQPEPKFTPITGGIGRHAGRDADAAAISSPESGRSSLIASNRTHVPYFRYFGPTAIVPGFKQMVVRVRESRKSNPSLSTESISSLRSSKVPDPGDTSSSALADCRASHSIPFYDPEDNLPVSSLITHLCDIFFTHLGCNFPFIQRDRFLRDLAEKRIEPILVDAVCALAARFSLHPLLVVTQPKEGELGASSTTETNHAQQGYVFARRAMCAIIDALPCPTVPAAQACLMLAHEEFGANHDSGLWMYLGMSIRMAQDLGMQKVEDIKYSYGRVGLTPKMVKLGQASRGDETQHKDMQASTIGEGADDEVAEERERVDTFWTIFFMDRVISSGTGRPVTLRDDDIEIFFPPQSETLQNGWPAPFPPLMRIIHLYGRVTDLLNAIKEVNHVTPDTLRQLAGMENDLTGIYQRLSPKLHFNAMNFQNYVKAGEGATFILLHVWFHALIVILHQPTLLHSFSGKIQQLFHNSRELSMSSAKTIADILAFAELIDARSFIGTPFSSQPIYVAACAFLMESALYSVPSSRACSPSQLGPADNSAKPSFSGVDTSTNTERTSNPKHCLLASAAKDNYQRCYKALKALETYWEGIKYILTVLDQKAKGIWDPLLYTEEEMDGAVEQPLAGPISPLGWKGTMAPPAPMEPPTKRRDGPHQAAQPEIDHGSPRINPSQAIGWALTGATNSSQPNLSFLYQLPPTQSTPVPRSSTELAPQHDDKFPYASAPDIRCPAGIDPYTPISPQYPATSSHDAQRHNQPRLVSPPGYTHISSAGVSSPESNPRIRPAPMFSSIDRTLGSPAQPNYPSELRSSHLNHGDTTPYNFQNASTQIVSEATHQCMTNHHPTGGLANLTPNTPGLTIESQDIDMNVLQDHTSFPFSFDEEFIPWLEYLPQDVLNYFGDHQGYRPVLAPEHPDDQGPPSV